jgi:hypothetical protein
LEEIKPHKKIRDPHYVICRVKKNGACLVG